MHVDGAKNNLGAGAGVEMKSLKGVNYEHAPHKVSWHLHEDEAATHHDLLQQWTD